MIVGVIGILAVILLLFLGMPVGLGLLLVGFVGFAYLGGVGAAGVSLASQILESVSGYAFTVLPVFILMGTICAYSGMGDRIYETGYKWMGQLRGGLAVATMVGCAGFAAVSGSSFATAATMAKVAFPEMEKRKYVPELSAGSIATGGTLAILIPPSTGFIVYALITEQSIGRLFMAGIIPGLIHVSLYIAVIAVWARVRPNAGPPGPRSSFREKMSSLGGTVEIFVLFALVLGGLFFGFFTPTEAGAAGAFGAIAIALIRRTLNWKQFVAALKESLGSSAMIILLVMGGFVFARFAAISRLPFELADWVVALPLPPIGILGVIMASYVVLGCIMSTVAMIFITVPIYFPIILALGYDPIWFGVMIVLVMEISMITPPIGMNVWIIAGELPHIPMERIFKGVLIFLIADITLVVILLAFPQVALFLPSLMG